MSDSCHPTTVLSGPADCLDGECEEYWAEDGEAREIPSCSHIREEQVCGQHSTFEESEWGYCTHAEPWPCAISATPSPQES